MSEKLQTPMIIWAALVCSMFIYAGILVVMDFSGEPQDVEVMRMALAVAAMGSLGAAAFFRGRLGHLGKRTLTIKDLDQRAKAVDVSFQTTSLVGWALTESVVIYGLVLSFLSHDPNEIWPFLIVGLVAMALQMPREDTLHAMYRAADLPTPS